MRVDDAVVLDAVSKITAMAPNTVITHLVMEEMLGVNRLDNPQKYYRMVNLLKHILERDHGIFLHNQCKIGYCILAPGNETGECIRDIMKGTKLTIRGTMRAQFIRVERIEDPNQRAKVIGATQKMANLAMMLRQGAQDFQKMLLA